MILARNPNFVGNLHSFCGINCYQIVFPNLAMVIRLHMSYKPRRLNNFCGWYEFFRKNSRKSEDFCMSQNGEKKLNFLNGRHFSNFIYFALISFVLSSSLLIHTFRHLTCNKTPILTQVMRVSNGGQNCPLPGINELAQTSVYRGLT